VLETFPESHLNPSIPGGTTRAKVIRVPDRLGVKSPRNRAKLKNPNPILHWEPYPQAHEYEVKLWWYKRTTNMFAVIVKWGSGNIIPPTRVSETQLPVDQLVMISCRQTSFPRVTEGSNE
jgi:hypothetical protein